MMNWSDDFMISNFNLEKLTTLLQDFYTITHIRITVFNEIFEEITSYPKERASFCQLIRTDTKARQRCKKCDEEACQMASSMHTTYVYECHAGLKEAIMPIYLSNIVIGYLFFGHVFAYDSYEAGWKVIEEKCKNYAPNIYSLKQACLKQPLISEDFILAASNLMHAIASYLCLERMVTLKAEDLPVKIDQFICAHYTENIRVATICKKFGIGKTKLYEIAKESYGIGISELIRKMRIKKATSLIEEDPMLSVSEVAALCGYSDYNYFITVFKKIAGVPPKKYARIS